VLLSLLNSNATFVTSCKVYLDKNSQAVKKGAALFKNGQYKKYCEIQADGQEMAVMVG